MVDSVITCDEIAESYNKKTKTVPTIFNGKKECNTQNFYILLAFLLIMIANKIYNKII